MIARLFIRNTLRLYGLNLRQFSQVNASATGTQGSTNPNHNQQHSRDSNNYRRERPDYRRNQQQQSDNKFQRRDDETSEYNEKEDKHRFESTTWDEYFNQHASARISNISEAKFCYNFKGMKDFVPIKKEYDNMIFAKGENYADYLKQFDRRMVWFMKALASNKDEDFPFSEINFLLQAKKGAEILRRNGYKINFVEDHEGFAKSGAQKSGQPFEISHIMGLSSQRTRNAGTSSYAIIRDLEEKGLIMFIGNQLKLDENGDYDFKLTRDDDKQMILRVHYKYTSPFILQITDPNGKIVSQQPESYTHTAVFENQLRFPPKFSRLDLLFTDWIKLYRIQQDWKLVDFDRFLNGNKLIYSDQEASQLYYIEKENNNNNHNNNHNNNNNNNTN